MPPKLNHWQRKAIGSSREQQPVWDSKVAKLYPKPHPDNLEDDDPSISQSYDDFVEMGNRLPNEMGTGRFKVGYDDRTVVYLFRLKDEEADEKLVEFASAYFGMVVKTLSIDLSLHSKGKKRKLFTFEDSVKSLSFPLEVNKKSNEIDVFSIFDVMVEYLPADAFTAVLLVDFPLCEGDISVYGRACGDRVAVVSSAGIDSKRDLYLTIVHELLHTMGVDHCESFACIMNPCSSPSSDKDELRTTVTSTRANRMELCPAELAKLRCIVEELDIEKRWVILERICRNEGWLLDAQWFDTRLQLFRSCDRYYPATAMISSVSSSSTGTAKATARVQKAKIAVKKEAIVVEFDS